jgi:hypothetical protein
MKKTIIAMVAGLSLMLPTQAFAEKVDPLVAFLFGAITVHILTDQNQQRPNQRPQREQVITYCIEKTWIQPRREWVNQHWDNGYLVQGHYRTRQGYYETTKYRC